MFELNTIFDQSSPCPYLPDRVARMPLETPRGEVTAAELDQLLDAGYRRSGWFYYRTSCPHCQACEPLRVEVAQFSESRSMRRVLKRGDDQLQVVTDRPTCDDARLSLFNRHRTQRKMARDDGDATIEDYKAFLVYSWNPTSEISYWLGDRLAAVAIVDVGQDALSAVYCYFDPDLEHLSLGTYSILTQIRLARLRNMRWVYLGMYVRENRHLSYKARYLPHQRFQAGSWRGYQVETQQA